ncbi:MULTISPECIES: mannose-1-phosphate guanylyltransferase [unclassified Carboxydocella]|uniref:mannose-1-phosphate guanylyltransferase n=1 Tax=unclassified Carboxydocella TaxID=2685367 RepID=UPI0009AD85B9|nr:MULTISPECIES: mannose-1-phosphate guanylyltransferase [unclassified Carboxydocella]GAW29749.1 mannose-1-phosphate guanylyltransferase [Carboxydocella sp. ULO1]GAW32434.1 mannose-1-phosphate guanylyltransferase [Carboxydocella sp. JDF658]
MDTYAVIMAGGTGTRFWPKSRSRFPKQFLPLFGNNSLLQTTFNRVNRILNRNQILVVTNKHYVQTVINQLPQCLFSNLLVEPVRRDTASCIGLAVSYIYRVNPEAVMVVLPSDHFVADEEKFLQTVQEGIEWARKGDWIITIGIKPSEPKTAYGYIELGLEQREGVWQVKSFREKPDLDTAIKYLEQGNFFWNAGIFIFRAEVMWRSLERYLPQVHQALNQVIPYWGTPQQTEIIKKVYRPLPKVSIDYGVMEKTDNLLVLTADFGWDDLGSWSVLGRVLPVSDEGNVVMGQHLGLDTSNCILVTENQLLATIGIKDLIVIATNDVILICPKDKDQEVKEMVKLVRNSEYRRYF